jgi:acyl carrier protein
MENLNQVVKNKISILKHSKMDLEGIYQTMFSDKKKINAEANISGKIVYFSYGDVENSINLIASTFKTTYPNVENQYIGIGIDNCIEWIEIFWAIIKTNNKPYLINLRHPKMFANEILTTLGVNYVIGKENLGYAGTFINVEDLKKGTILNHFTFSNEIALSTSATTLKQKVVFYTGQELAAQILNCNEILGKNKIFRKHYKGKLKLLMFLPLYHIFGLIATYFWFCFFSRTIVFLNDYSSDVIIKTIQQHQVTHIFAVPLFYHTIEKKIYQELATQNEKTKKKFNRGIDFAYQIQALFPNLGRKISRFLLKDVNNRLFGKSVQVLVTGGSYIKDSTLKLISSLGYPLLNGYGMSEIGITSVELRKNIKKRIQNSIGINFPSVTYLIKDGTLYCKGASLSHKMMIDGQYYYLGEDEYYSTQDLCEYKDGGYYILGRKDDVFISSNGENINPDLLEKYFTLDAYGIYSILNLENKLTLILQIPLYYSYQKINEIYQEIINKNNGLASMRVSDIYFTYDEMISPGAIKVSREYVRRKILNHQIKLLTINDFDKKTTSNDYNEKIMDIIISLISEVLSIKKEDIHIDSHFMLDLNGTSLDFFNLIYLINEKFDITIVYQEGVAIYTPYQLTKLVESMV